MMLERNIYAYGILAYGGIADGSSDLGVEPGKFCDGEKIVDAAVDFKILHKEPSGDVAWHSVAELYVFASQIGGVVYEGIAGDIVLAVGTIAESGIF